MFTAIAGVDFDLQYDNFLWVLCVANDNDFVSRTFADELFQLRQANGFEGAGMFVGLFLCHITGWICKQRLCFNGNICHVCI